MLKLEHLAWKLPTGEEIIKDIDLTIPDNKLVVITGPNGGGKTTTAKMIAGIVTPDSGRIILDGEDITDCDITQRARKGIAFAFQQPVRFKGLTVRDMLEMASGKNLAEESACAYLSNVGLCASEYIDREIRKKEYPPYKASGMAYILFAGEEKELFKLLYMRDRSRESVSEDTELNRTMTDMVAEGTGLAGDRSRLFHLEMWAFVHGIAAMSATGFLDLPRELISDMLTDCYNGLKLRFGGEK